MKLTCCIIPRVTAVPSAAWASKQAWGCWPDSTAVAVDTRCFQDGLLSLALVLFFLLLGIASARASLPDNSCVSSRARSGVQFSWRRVLTPWSGTGPLSHGPPGGLWAVGAGGGDMGNGWLQRLCGVALLRRTFCPAGVVLQLRSLRSSLNLSSYSRQCDRGWL